MARSGYRTLTHAGNFFSHILLLIIRLYWGGLLVFVGLSKWMNLTATETFFESLNIPFPYFMAGFVGLIELLGGISLFLGFLTRFFGLLLSILFIIAYVTAHSAALIQFFINPNLFIEQKPFLYLYASLIAFCFGAGNISIDRLFVKS